MNRLVRTLVGVVVAKAAIVAGWYLYTKSTENENDWKSEGKEPEAKPSKFVVVTKEETVVESKQEEKPTEAQPLVKKVVTEEKPAVKKTVRKPVVKKVVAEEKSTVTKKPRVKKS